MPNWCNNLLTMKSKNRKLLNEVQSSVSKGIRADQEKGLLNHFRPMPDDLTDTVKGFDNSIPEWQKKSSKLLEEKHGADNWYDWQCKNWGTKWDVYCDDIKEWDVKKEWKGPYHIALEFDTAWGPPTEAIKRLKMSYAAQISFLRILYVAEGDYCGIYNGLTGEHIEDAEFIDDPEMPKLTAKYQENEDPVWDYGWIQEEVEDRVNEVAEYHNERLKEVGNG